MLNEGSPQHIIPSFESYGDLTVRPRIGLNSLDQRLLFVAYAVSEEEGGRVANEIAHKRYDRVIPGHPDHAKQIEKMSLHEFLSMGGMEHFDVLRTHDNTLLYVTHAVPGVENTYITVDSGAVYRLRPEYDILTLLLVAYPENDENIEDVAELLAPEEVKTFARDFRMIRNYRAIDHVGEPGSLPTGDLLTLFQQEDIRHAWRCLEETGTLMKHVAALRERYNYAPEMNALFVSQYKPLSSFLKEEFGDVLECSQKTKKTTLSVLLSNVAEGSSVRYACINPPFEPYEFCGTGKNDASWTAEQWREYFKLYRNALSLVWEIPAGVTTKDVEVNLPGDFWDIPAYMDTYGRRLNLTTLGEYEDFYDLNIRLMKAQCDRMEHPQNFIQKILRKRKPVVTI